MEAPDQPRVYLCKSHPEPWMVSHRTFIAGDGHNRVVLQLHGDIFIITAMEPLPKVPYTEVSWEKVAEHLSHH